MAYTLRMSGEIREWLADLCTSRPDTAAAVGRALTALLDAGPGLGPPIVVSLDTRPASANPVEDLDCPYQRRLERLHAIRRAVADIAQLGKQMRAHIAEAEASQSTAAADAADRRERLADLDRAEGQLTRTYQRMQSDADAFRVRKEVLKARYTSAEAGDAMAGIYPTMAAVLDDEDLAPYARSPAERAARLEDITAEIGRELSKQSPAEGLMELRPGVPGSPADDLRIVFAVEPPGTVLPASADEVRAGADDLVTTAKIATAKLAGPSCASNYRRSASKWP